jgi:hypothetical protein
MIKIVSFLVGALLLGSPLNGFAKEIKDTASGESFPDTVSFESEGGKYNLDITGTALRKKFIVKVYGVAHYLEKGTELKGDKFEDILNDDKAKQLTMKWLRGATVEQVQSGYRESFKIAVADTSAISKEIDTFVAFFNAPVNKGDVHVLRWLPSGEIEVEINGKKAGTIKNGEFAKDLWSIWLGPSSVVNRDALISLIK